MTSVKRDFLAIPDLSRGGARRAAGAGAAPEVRVRSVGRPLAGKTLAMIFRKSSTRTRVSFEVGMTQLGGHALFLSDRDSQMGRGESDRTTPPGCCRATWTAS